MPAVEEVEPTSPELESTNVFDPYLYRVEMPLTKTYYPLGFPLQLTTNSEDVLQAAEECWSAFERRFEVPATYFRIGVREDKSEECPPAPIFRGHRDLIVGIADQGNFLINEIVNGYSFAWLTTAAVSRRSYLRYHYLEAAALCHIANRYAAPIHAACVALDGHGILLCGDSGAGKSTLAFACARAGWTYVTDDASFLLHDLDGRQVMGNCHLIRLRPSATRLFPEVAGEPLTPRVAGKPSVELRTADLSEITPANSANVDSIVFLNRRDASMQELIKFPKGSARRYIHQRLCAVDELRKAQNASVERLLDAEIFELRYRDLDWAVDRLERLVREKQ